MKRKPSAARIRAFVAKARASAKAPGKIPGGKAARRHPRSFGVAVLEEGTTHELEHTTSMAVALEIAMDHLAEDRRYYQKLAKIEAPRARRLAAKLYGGRVVR